MKYVISEEELNEHIFAKLTYWLKASSQLDDIIVNRGKCADDITESFLKSKTPVEEIAISKADSDCEYRKLMVNEFEDIGTGWAKELGIISNDEVKIYIEVIK